MLRRCVALTTGCPARPNREGLFLFARAPPGRMGLEGEALHICGIRRGAKEGELNPPPLLPCLARLPRRR